MSVWKFTATASRWLWTIVAFLIIAFAILVVLGRFAIQSLPEYQQKIADEISAQIGYPIEFKELSGDWYGFSPKIYLREISLYSSAKDEAPALSAQSLTAEPDLLGSLRHGTLVWKQLVLSGLKLRITEELDGSWSLNGIKGMSGGSGGLETVSDFLFASRLLELESLSAEVQFVSGVESGFRLHDVQIENAAGFHRVQANVRSAGEEEMATLLIEGWGDPLNWREFKGGYYLELNRIDNTGLLAAAFQNWLPATFDKVGEVETDINTQIWIGFDGSGRGVISGHIEAAEIPLNWIRDVPPIVNYHAMIGGEYVLGSHWQVGLHDVEFEWRDEAIRPVDIIYREDATARMGEGSLALSQVNLEILNRLVTRSGLLPESAESALKDLNPRGAISPLWIDSVGGDEGLRFLVRGNLRDVEIDSIRKAPASRNINGYFEATTRGGLLELSSPSGLAIWYPTAYDDYMEHGSVTGRVDWLLDKEVGALKLNSGPLAISGEDGQGVAYLALNIPFNRAEGAGDMYLQVGVRDSHSRYRHQYIPRTLKPELAKWLDDAIGDAVVNEMGFIWRGSLAKTEHEKRSLQLYFNVESADLAFQSDWPALKNADAIVTVDGGAAEGTVTAGVLKDLNVQSASFRLVQSTPEKPLHVRVEGDVRGDASEALAFLLASPVSNRILALSEWRSGGDLSATVDLEIPLIGGYEPRILVRATAKNGELSDPSETLVLDRINTDLVYDSRRGGLFADRFSARLWGDSSVRGALATDDQGIRISSSSKVSAKTLERIFQWPLDPLITGTALVSSDIRIPADGSPVTLKLDSDMAGLSSTLPAPFGKTSDSKLPAHLSLTFGEQWQYDFTLSQEEISSHLTGVLRTVDGKLASGIITLGGDEGEGGVPAGEEKVEGEQADDGQLKVLGHLDRVDLNQWMPVFKHFAENAAQSGNFAPDLSLAVDEFTVGSMAMTAVQLSGGRGAQDEAIDWVFDFTSDIADGSLLLPSDEAGLLPVSLSLHRLTIETDQKSDIEETDEPDVDELSVEAVPPVAAVEESDESDVMIESDVVESSRLASINPGDLPTLNFSVERLEYGDKIFGPLSLNVRPYDSGSSSGVRFERIEGQLGGFEIVSEQVNSSVLDWRVEDGVVTSRFEGVVETGNLGKVMEFWGYPKALESKSANFIAELGWSGAPDQFSLENLDGLITLGIQDGKFNRTSGSAADAMMRMVGLFNFANWVRRLRLDFSDVLGSGMSFDEMTGGLRFSRGQLAFDDPIEVKLPSGRMRLSGTANLVDESLDANLVMTVPVATNLPWIAALAGGLPAAAGVYLTSKVFEKEVDKLSSFNYSLKGDWADPEIRVEKIFSD